MKLGILLLFVKPDLAGLLSSSEVNVKLSRIPIVSALFLYTPIFTKSQTGV